MWGEPREMEMPEKEENSPKVTPGWMLQWLVEDDSEIDDFESE